MILTEEEKEAMAFVDGLLKCNQDRMIAGLFVIEPKEWDEGYREAAILAACVRRLIAGEG